jgi:hydroxyethylthiazole kinase-like uncharacterized protein yjeF
VKPVEYATARGVWPLVSAATMRALDRHTIDKLGVPSDLLMESAGRSVASEVLSSLAEQASSGEVCVVCGGGNNGGDGLVAARHLALLGVPTRVVLLTDPERLRGDAASNLARARALGLDISYGNEASSPLPSRGVVVDAIFGTGLSREVAGPAAEMILAINAARAACRDGALRVLSVDVPSGLDSDTGQPQGQAVRADSTVTMGLPKLGLVLEPGRALAGQIVVARIGIADVAPGVRSDAELWSPLAAGRALPARPVDGHKGRFGHVLLVAGSAGKTGAAALSATAAGRAGAGLVTLACPASLNPILEVKCTEAMTAPLADTTAGELSAAAEHAVLALAAERDVVAMGPGVGRSEETQALMRGLARRIERPLVIDADGLFAFADDPSALKARRAPTILTPHPGEAARLLGRSAGAVNRDRVGTARELARMTGAVVILKGAGTVSADPDGRIVVNPTGGSYLATGGTGDVLTGVVAAFLAQGQAALESAAAAAYLHGASADRLVTRMGRAGLLAEDVAHELPAAAEALRVRVEEASDYTGEGQGLALPFPGR